MNGTGFVVCTRYVLYGKVAALETSFTDDLQGLDLYSRTLILTLTDYSIDKKSWQDRDALKRGFIKHNEHIRSVVPKERLLEYNLGDGWGPLCKFLGKPVPDEPYPWINEGDNTKKMHLTAFRTVLFLIAVKWLLWAGGAAAAWAAYRYWYQN